MFKNILKEASDMEWTWAIGFDELTDPDGPYAGFGLTEDILLGLGFVKDEDAEFYYFYGDASDNNGNGLPDVIDNYFSPPPHMNPSWDHTGG